ncbi:helix-turn-helix transcriptional regulator [Anaerorhabdus sp.]|uniref:helix-turn-helix transcriptional regulator n=1 Tax=Anaerorhabdus sp. TaxID=1872524 RepID=UPI002B208BB5|nr:helix-turn-helix transcriptional regulator [Anaerorhabdus sp.]MEA4875296.1 helix-turn-helix transcriptional regulator [Anaerorhabdus sp.]
MSIEQDVKELILKEYRSIREFAIAIDLPYSTVDTILKKGFAKAGVQNVIKICNALDIDIDSLSNGTIAYKQKKEDNDVSFDDFRFALYGEVKDLTEGQKEDLLNFARFLKSNNK